VQDDVEAERRVRAQQHGRRECGVDDGGQPTLAREPRHRRQLADLDQRVGQRLAVDHLRGAPGMG